MNKFKISYGIVAITTIVLMFATTIGSAMNQADALPQRAVGAQNAEQRSDQINQRGLVDVAVGNANVQVQVPANVCVICGR